MFMQLINIQPLVLLVLLESFEVYVFMLILWSSEAAHHLMHRQHVQAW